MKFKSYLLIFISILSSQAQNLNKIESSIVQQVDQQLPATMQLLIESVNINSGTLNHKGVRQVGELYRKEFESIGFQTEWISLPDSLNRAGHLVATRTGKKGKKLFLIGHLDTVFEPSMPAGTYTIIDDSTATGQGLNDMKGGNAVVIASLKALHSKGLLDDASITVYFTGDEESAGKPSSISRKDFIDRANQCDVALAYETAMGLNIATTARRGASGWELTTTGKTGHSSGVFNQNMGFGAIYEASRILNEFQCEFRKVNYLTLNPGMIVGGTEVSVDPAKAEGRAVGKTNIVSQKVVVNGDLRFISEKQKEETRLRMREIVSKNLHKTGAKIKFSDGIPAMEPSPKNEALLMKLSKVSEDLGYGVVRACDPGLRGAGDISYIAAKLACLDGLGASGFGAHSPGETINLKELPKLIKRNALLIYRLVNE